MENSPEHLLIVAHQAILRCIVTYLLRGDLRKLPNTKIPQHCLISKYWNFHFSVRNPLFSFFFFFAGVTYLNGENIIDYIRTPIDHYEQGIVKSVLNDMVESQKTC